MLVKMQMQKNAQWMEGPLLQLDPEEVEKDHKTIWQTALKLTVKFGQNVPKMPKAEQLAKEIAKDMEKFRDQLPVIRSICNPGLKERHFEEIRHLLEGKRIEKNEKLKTLI